MVVPSLTPEELEALEILADPCKWAAIELGGMHVGIKKK